MFGSPVLLLRPHSFLWGGSRQCRCLPAGLLWRSFWLFFISIPPCSGWAQLLGSWSTFGGHCPCASFASCLPLAFRFWLLLGDAFPLVFLHRFWCCWLGLGQCSSLLVPFGMVGLVGLCNVGCLPPLFGSLVSLMVGCPSTLPFLHSGRLGLLLGFARLFVPLLFAFLLCPFPASIYCGTGGSVSLWGVRLCFSSLSGLSSCFYGRCSRSVSAGPPMLVM